MQWMDDMNYFDSLFVQGRSLGSVCAAEIGAHNPPKLKGIIFESGFASIFNMMTNLFGVRNPDLTPDSLKEYSNDTRVQKFNIPTLIIHGTRDGIIPYSESQLIYQNLPNNVEKNIIVSEINTKLSLRVWNMHNFRNVKVYLPYNIQHLVASIYQQKFVLLP